VGRWNGVVFSVLLLAFSYIVPGNDGLVSLMICSRRAKLCADRSRRCGDMAVFNFSRWRPSAILDLWYACLDHPRSVFGGLCHCAKFGLNRCSSFDNMQVLIFWALSLKMPIHAPFSGVFGAKIGDNGNFMYFYPPRNATHPETRILRYNVSKSVQRFDL